MKFLAFLAIVIFSSNILSAQELTDVRGKVFGIDDDTPLVGATVRLISAKDTTIVKGAFADREGVFKIKDIPVGAYRLSITYVGYSKLESTTFVRSSRSDLGSYRLKRDTSNNREVQVEGVAIRAEVRGDTVDYNAAAFKTNPNATAEDLVKKMPGITVENGVIKAQGEEVRKVTVDGREFFGDDASATLKNMPSDMVDRVQVYDRGSDLSMFSGFDDGNTQKTMNVVTKKDKRNGSFGKTYGGYGSKDRYNIGATLNDFRESQRLSILGMSNNINQQNFAFQDILGATGMGGSQMGRMMSRYAGSGAGALMMTSGGGGGGGGAPSSFSNFFNGQQGGISSTSALGVNYSDQFGKTNVSSSYFFNYADNARQTTLDRDYISPSIADQRYGELNTANTISRNHRFNARIESFIDSANALTVSPRIVYQSSNSNSLVQGVTTNVTDTLNSTNTGNDGTNGGYTAAVSTTYRHLFPLRGRSVAATFSIDGSNRWNGGSLDAQNAFYTGIDTVIRLDQRSNGGSTGISLGGQLAWTEPIGETDMLQLSYEPNYNRNTSTKTTNSPDPTGNFTVVDTLLSNTFENTYITQRAGALYRWRMENTIVTFGGNYQYAELSGIQQFPLQGTVSRNFSNVLPTFMVQHKFSTSSNLRFFYRTNTSAPSISQLQNVVDNSNPVQLRVGNPNLLQAYTHSVNARFVKSDWLVGRTIFGFLNIGYTANYIGTGNVITQRDTVIGNNVSVGPGTQITAPVNLEGMWNARAFFTYGFPVFGANLNLNSGINYSRTPGRINTETNFANSTTGNLGFFLGSANSEDLDVSASYNASYTWVANTLQRSADDNYFTQIASVKVVWNIGALACSTDVNNTLYKGLGTSFDRVFTVWNAGIGYRFFENRSAELRITIFDILNQNDAINRTINDISVEDSRTNALRQYAMLTFTYDLKAFGK
ncbi:MAG: outer membrane beta-barrel protein [Candidatus Kapabacteria bacterium]|nr:outer membrane beta-barrel protein [Candidatus Kapabacteria bacterium]